MNQIELEITIKDLAEWHEHQAAECRHIGEEDQKEFHQLATEALNKIINA